MRAKTPKVLKRGKQTSLLILEKNFQRRSYPGTKREVAVVGSTNFLPSFKPLRDRRRPSTNSLVSKLASKKKVKRSGVSMMKILTSKKKELQESFIANQDNSFEKSIMRPLKKELLFTNENNMNDVLLLYMKYFGIFISEFSHFERFLDPFYKVLSKTFSDFLQKYSNKEEDNPKNRKVAAVEHMFKDQIERLNRKIRNLKDNAERDGNNISKLENRNTELKKKNIVLRVCLADEKEKYLKLHNDLVTLEKKQKKQAIPVSLLVNYEKMQVEKTEYKSRIRLLEEEVATVEKRDRSFKSLERKLSEKKIKIDRLMRENEILQRQMKKLKRYLNALKMRTSTMMFTMQPPGSKKRDVIRMIENEAIQKEEKLTPRPSMSKLLLNSSISTKKVIRHRTTKERVMQIISEFDGLEKRLSKVQEKNSVFEKHMQVQKLNARDALMDDVDQLYRPAWLHPVDEEQMQKLLRLKNKNKEKELVSTYDLLDCSELGNVKRFPNLKFTRKQTNDLLMEYWTLKKIDPKMCPKMFLVGFVKKTIQQRNGIMMKEEKNLPPLKIKQFIYSLYEALREFRRGNRTINLVYEIFFGQMSQDVHYSQMRERDNFFNYALSFQSSMKKDQESKSKVISKELFQTILRGFYGDRISRERQGKLLDALDVDFPFVEKIDVKKLFSTSTKEKTLIFLDLFNSQFLIDREIFLNEIEDKLLRRVGAGNERESLAFSDDTLTINQIYQTLLEADPSKPSNVWDAILERGFNQDFSNVQTVLVNGKKFYPNQYEIKVREFMKNIRTMDIGRHTH